MRRLADLAGDALIRVKAFTFEVGGVSRARFAQDCAVTALVVGAVGNQRRRGATRIALTDDDSVVTEVHRETLVEDVQ